MKLPSRVGSPLNVYSDCNDAKETLPIPLSSLQLLGARQHTWASTFLVHSCFMVHVSAHCTECALATRPLAPLSLQKDATFFTLSQVDGWGTADGAPKQRVLQSAWPLRGQSACGAFIPEPLCMKPSAFLQALLSAKSLQLLQSPTFMPFPGSTSKVQNCPTVPEVALTSHPHGALRVFSP